MQLESPISHGEPPPLTAHQLVARWSAPSAPRPPHQLRQLTATAARAHLWGWSGHEPARPAHLNEPEEREGE